MASRLSRLRGEAKARRPLTWRPLANIAPDDAWRRLARPSRADVHKGGKNFQDLVGSYLCSAGHKILNARTLRGLDPSEVSASDLAAALVQVADQTFSDDYDDHAPGSAHQAARYRLDRDKLVNSMPHRAAWVLSKNDPEKIRGRQRGGSQGRAQGVRKGPVPRLVPGLIADFWHVAPAERKTAFQSVHPCSDSTFYLLRAAEEVSRTNVGPVLWGFVAG